MRIYLIMLTVCVMTQRVYSKSLFDYNINPNYDLIAQESASHLNSWPSSEFVKSANLRYKHQVGGKGNGIGRGKANHKLPAYYIDSDESYIFLDSSEEYFDDRHHSSHSHYIPPVHSTKHGYPHGHQHGHHYDHPRGHPRGHSHSHPRGHPHGHPHDRQSGHQHVIPPQFPPSPVYNKDFLNPWTLSVTTPKQLIIEDPPVPKTRPSVAPPVNVSPAILTTPAPSTTPTTQTAPSSTEAEDQLMYDIDVRFGRD